MNLYDRALTAWIAEQHSKRNPAHPTPPEAITDVEFAHEDGHHLSEATWESGGSYIEYKVNGRSQRISLDYLSPVQLIQEVGAHADRLRA